MDTRTCSKATAEAESPHVVMSTSSLLLLSSPHPTPKCAVSWIPDPRSLPHRDLHCTAMPADAAPYALPFCGLHADSAHTIGRASVVAVWSHACWLPTLTVWTWADYATAKRTCFCWSEWQGWLLSFALTIFTFILHLSLTERLARSGQWNLPNVHHSPDKFGQNEADARQHKRHGGLHGRRYGMWWKWCVMPLFSSRVQFSQKRKKSCGLLIRVGVLILGQTLEKYSIVGPRLCFASVANWVIPPPEKCPQWRGLISHFDYPAGLKLKRISTEQTIGTKIWCPTKTGCCWYSAFLCETTVQHFTQKTVQFCSFAGSRCILWGSEWDLSRAGGKALSFLHTERYVSQVHHDFSRTWDTWQQRRCR